MCFATEVRPKSSSLNENAPAYLNNNSLSLLQSSVETLASTPSTNRCNTDARSAFSSLPGSTVTWLLTVTASNSATTVPAAISTDSVLEFSIRTGTLITRGNNERATLTPGNGWLGTVAQALSSTSPILSQNCTLVG